MSITGIFLKYSSCLVFTLCFLFNVTVVCAQTFNVNITTDSLDISPGDGFCIDALGKCSLRAAVQESNALVGADNIVLKKAVYQLSIKPPPYALVDSDETGDLDITGELSLQGAGSNESIIDGGKVDRILQLAEGSSLLLDGITIRNGSTLFAGGGIWVTTSAQLNLSNCIVTDNESTYSSGGGIYSSLRSNTTIKNCIISYNTSYQSAGGIGNGNECMMDIRNSTINDNQARGNGGGILTGSQSNTTVNASVIYNNTAGAHGGGIGAGSNASSSTLKLINTTISGNHSLAGIGGGVFVGKDNTAQILNSTIVNNDASLGGGIVWGGTSVYNSIIADNTDTEGVGPDCLNRRGVVSQGYNLIGNDLGCSLIAGAGDQIGTYIDPVNPLLMSLADNGGPTLTHALFPNSPAIDAGNSSKPGSGGAACELIDQRGAIRIGRGACDVGAFEATGGGDVWITALDDVDVTPSYELVQQVITVGNKGPHKVGRLTLSIILPIGTQNINVNGDQWQCAPNANIIHCTRYALNAQAQSLLEVRFSPPIDNKEVITQAGITTVSDDPIEKNNQLEWITIINKAPIITTKRSISYKMNNNSIAIAPTVKVVDKDDILLTSASIQIVQGYRLDEDELYWNGSASITAEWEPQTAMLDLTGEDTVEAYEQALSEVVYINEASDVNLNQRGVIIKVSDTYDQSAAASIAISLIKKDDASEGFSGSTDNAEVINPFAEEDGGYPGSIQGNNKKTKETANELMKEKKWWYVFFKIGNKKEQESNLSDHLEDLSNKESPWSFIGDMDYDDKWVDIEGIISNSDAAFSNISMVTAGSVFFAGAVNLYIRSLSFLGAFFSSPLLISFDPIPLMLISNKERLRRRKDLKKAGETEDRDGRIGELLDEKGEDNI